MKTLEQTLPPRSEIARLVRAVRSDICSDYRCTDDPDDTTPGILLTVGASLDGSWSWQTGDNSFTGGAYGHAHWGIGYVYRRSNSFEVADTILDELAEAMAYDFEQSQKQA